MTSRTRGSSQKVVVAALVLVQLLLAPVSQADTGDGDRSVMTTASVYAQFYFGVMLAGGYGVPHNPAKAASWVRKAADQGLAQAQFYLAGMYLSGHGVPRDSTAAAPWLRKAAEHGLARAQVQLGYLYQTGEAFQQDFKAAMHWYLKAAEQEDTRATIMVGTMYFGGIGIAADKVRGYQWIARAARAAEKDLLQDHSDAARNIYQIAMKVFREYESMLTPEQIAQAQALEKEWQMMRGR